MEELAGSSSALWRVLTCKIATGIAVMVTVIRLRVVFFKLLLPSAGLEIRVERGLCISS